MKQKYVSYKDFKDTVNYFNELGSVRFKILKSQQKSIEMLAIGFGVLFLMYLFTTIMTILLWVS